MNFTTSATTPEKETSEAYWFIFNNKNELIINSNASIESHIPLMTSPSERSIPTIRQQYLGQLNGTDCYSAEFDESSQLNEDVCFCEFRGLYGVLPDELYALIGHASQIVTWDKNHQFCGKCGSPATTSQTLRAKQCTSCGFMNFPRISPSIIVAVIRDGQLLMARSPHFRPGLYSVVAGFVEAGESLEECVAREVMEETGISVKNIRYHSSQPWAFPHSLMCGFIADYAGGEINIDPHEIEDAMWATPETFPDELPSPSTIAHDLINHYVELCHPK